MQRSNQAWLDELQGRHGNERLEAAHRDLSRYLYAVATAQLYSRQSSIPLLNSFDAHEIGELASDFVQQTLEKLVRNQCALLETYEGRGNFTGWVAVIILNEVRQELRRPYWHRTLSFDPYRDSGAQAEEEQQGSAKVHPAYRVSSTQEPEASVLRAMAHEEVGRALQGCMNGLREMQRTLFWEVECEKRAVNEVARAHGMTPTAVSLQLMRARRGLRQCLEQKGINAEILVEFAYS